MECAFLAAMYIVLCIVCAFVAFLSGLAFSKYRLRSEPRAEPELDENQRARLKKQQREYENFMNYDGSRQE